MAPIKFEENIKDKLEKRTLEPSSQAWETLSKKMDSELGNSSKKTFLWLGIAASLVGVLVMVNVFFETIETVNQIPVLVDSEGKEINNIQNNNPVEPEEVIVVTEDIYVAPETISKENIVRDKKPKMSKNNLVKNTKKAEVEPLQEPQEIINNLNLETSLYNTNLAQIEIQENNKKTKTDVDALLKKAQQNIADKTTKKAYSIDAKSLLQDVEEDLEESFRAKVFETIKTNYKKVKTAVAQRND